MSIKKLIVILITSFLLLELFILFTNSYFFHWTLKEDRVDNIIVTGILFYVIGRFRQKNGYKLEAENYYKVFALFFISVLSFKALIHIFVSYNSATETLYFIFNKSFFDKFFWYLLSTGVNIWFGIWLGNGNIEKFLLKTKRKIFSSQDEHLILDIHKLFKDYQIETLIEKNKTGSFDLMLIDNQDIIKATHLLDSIIKR